MSRWTLVYSRQAQKDARKLASAGLKTKAQHLLAVLAEDPFAVPPRREKLVGDLAGCYSRRINIQHRLVYEVLPDQHVVHVLRMGTHFPTRPRNEQIVASLQARDRAEGPTTDEIVAAVHAGRRYPGRR